MRETIESSRDLVATSAKVNPRQIVFLASIQEAYVTALHSHMRLHPGCVIYSSPIELSVLYDFSKTHSLVHNIIPVDVVGRLDLSLVEETLKSSSKPGDLLCVQVGNQEIGTLQDYEGLIDIGKRYGLYTLLDAHQAFLSVSLDLGTLDPTYCILSGAPRGALRNSNALVVSFDTKLEPLILGGSEERGRRAGLEDVLSIMAFGIVCDLFLNDPSSFQSHDKTITQHLVKMLSGLDYVQFYGDVSRRLAHIVCFGLRDVEAEPMVIGLDSQGISVHSGSACSSEINKESHVLAAINANAQNSLRISSGWQNTLDEVEKLIIQIDKTYHDLRSLIS